jgi:alpha-L-rhamnosidase
MTPPVLAWDVSAVTPLPTTPEFRVRLAGASDAPAAALWESTTNRPWAVYDGGALQPRTEYRWTVSTATDDGEVTESAPATFETGLAPEDWRAQWIAAPPYPYAREGDDPCPYLRTELDLEHVPARARLYATALGLYRIWVNGTELTANEHFRPGWTDYRVRVHHQTFDCTDLLVAGRNTIAAVVAKGWYAGRLGLMREPAFYGARPALLAQLEGDGAVLATTTPAWRASSGSVVAADLIRGEVRDLRREPAGWQHAGFDAGTWQTCEPITYDGEVVPQPHDSIATFRVHQGDLVREHGRGPIVFDFGQNLVGWTRITGPFLPTVELVVRHGELLTPEQLVYRDNLRGAFQEDRYAVPDDRMRTLEPAFTMHGFRYAEVWGLPGNTPYGAFELRPDCSIEAVSVTGLPRRTGTFACSDPTLTRLAENVEWTVRDNFLEVATDCPQRDERHGWLGDAGVIGATAAYHFDLTAFLTKFVQDACDAQGPDGEVRNYVPAIPPADRSPGAPGWSDGYIRLVHLLVQRYGGLPTARRLFASMRAFLDHVDRHNPSGLRTEQVGADFGDWLSLPGSADEEPHPGYAWTGAHSTTPRPVVDTAQSYRSFVQLAEIADRLALPGEAEPLRRRAAEIRDAYRAEFVLPDGSFKNETQTAYAQAIGFGLVTGADAVQAAAHLRRLVESAGHVTTGIHGVQHVLPALADHGHADLALELLLRRAMPGWLYMVDAGATTIWEKWDGVRPDGTLATAEMNSFNHCALGAVGQFLFERVAGLDARDTLWTGEVRIRAHYASRLDWARASYDGPGGRITSSWRREGTSVVHDLVVPGGIRARFDADAGAAVDVDGRPASAPVLLDPGAHTVVLTGVGS